MAISFTFLWQSFVISTVAILGITLIADYIQRGGKPLPKDSKRFFLFRIITDETGRCSLSFFQFLLWTLVVSFFFLMIYVIRLLSGTLEYPTTIPTSLLALMGISVLVPFLSKAISDYRRSSGARSEQRDKRSLGCAAMLEDEDGKPILNRYQMFLWTWLGIGIYIFWFLRLVTNPDTTVAALDLPDIDPTLVYLMGLSQTGFLAGKLVSGKKEPKITPPTVAEPRPATEEAVTGIPKITDIQPREMAAKQHVIITGENFGQTIDGVILGSVKLPSDSIKRWEDRRIELDIPEGIAPGTHDVNISLSSGASNKERITVRQPATVTKGGYTIHRAEIVGDLWSDNPGTPGAWDQPNGFRDISRFFHVFYKFKVPPGTDPYGRTLFKTEIWIDGNLVRERSDMPNPMPEGNIGAYWHKFDDEGIHRIEVRGANTVTRDILIKKGQQ